MTKGCNIFLMGIFVCSMISTGVQAAVEWSGSGRVFHQRWSFGEGDNSTDRQREKVDFFLNGEAQVSESIRAQIRFRHYTLDFQDKVDAFQLNRANMTWNYSESGFFKMGLMGVEDINIGDHMRAYYNHRMGMTWRHKMEIGPGMIFMGFSRFALGDKAGKKMTDQTMYYTPQLGYEMKMGDYHLLLGGTYHLYSSLDPVDFESGYVVLGRTKEDRGDYAGLEFFGKLMGRMGDFGWHAKFAMFSNGEAPEAAKDEDKKVTLMGFGVDYGKASVMMEMNNHGTYGVNRAVVNKDWCGFDVKGTGKSTCDSMKISASYKLNKNFMPKLEFVQSTRNNDGVDLMDETKKHLKDQKYSMMRLALNFKF